MADAPLMRTPPHNLALEEQLLGALLLSRKPMDELAGTLMAEHFYKPAHAHVFDAIQLLHSLGEPVDVHTVAEQLNVAGLLDAVGGPQLLVKLQTSSPAVSNAPRYAKIVMGHAVMRALINTAAEIAELGYTPTDDPDKALEQAEALILGIADGRLQETGVLLSDLLDGELEYLEKLYEAETGITGIATGLIDLDEMLGGLQAGQLVVLGARPAMGKTAAATTFGIHACGLGVPVLHHTLEMSRTETVRRIMSSEGRIDSQRMRTGHLNEKDWDKLSIVVNALSGLPYWIEDDPTANVLQMRAKARRLKSRFGKPPLVIVDYVQLMTGRGRVENRQLEIAEISRGLKIMAREIEAPVLALAQLNRQLETRADKRPMLSDLRESGALEQDADVVVFLYRDEVYNRETEDHGIAEFIVAKNRNGPTGTVKAAWLGQYTRMVNIARH